LFSASPCVRIAAALAAVATVAAGCSSANNLTSGQASAQAEQPYKTMYGISSEGTTTDVYTMIFGPSQPPPAPATAVATAQPTQPVTTQPIAPVQPVAPVQQTATVTSPTRPGQAATAAAANRMPQAASPPPPPVQVAQPPAPPPPPPEPDVPTAYGITANGPTTDLYTMIFGPRRSDGQ
jgi:hypothetical protein